MKPHPPALRRYPAFPGALPAWATVALLALGVAGCDRSTTEPLVDGVVVGEIILAGDDGSYTFSHRDHWHGAPVVRQGGSVGYTLHFTERQMGADDHDIPPVEEWFTLADHPDLSVQVVIEDPTLARWTGDRVRGQMEGLQEGASRISFVVRRGTTTLYEAPPLNFRVQPPL